MATKATPAATLTNEELHNLTYLDVITQAGDAVLKSITESQEQFLAAAKQAAETMPKAPEFTAPVGISPEVIAPSAREVIEVSFSFADKLLAAQKAFADKYLALTGA